MSKEALQIALEALTDFDYDKRMKAIETIKRSLETKDEPVAWMNKHGACKTSLFREEEAGAKEEYTIPVYTQPQRTWVGLTDEEIDQGLCRTNYVMQTAGAWRDGVEWASKQLQERNS